MDKRLTKVFFIITIIIIATTSSCSKQITSMKIEGNKTNDSLAIKEEKVLSLYKNLRDINGGEKLKFDFNLSSTTPHPNTTKNRNNSKNTVLSDHTIKTNLGKEPNVKLVHRN